VEKAEAVIDWAQPAATITRRVRAFNPFPGASTLLHGEPLKVWAASVGTGTPPTSQSYGQILAVAHTGIAVEAMDSIVLLNELQRPGGKRLGVADFLRGFDLQPGTVLG